MFPPKTRACNAAIAWRSSAEAYVHTARACGVHIAFSRRHFSSRVLTSTGTKSILAPDPSTLAELKIKSDVPQIPASDSNFSIVGSGAVGSGAFGRTFESLQDSTFKYLWLEATH